MSGSRDPRIAVGAIVWFERKDLGRADKPPTEAQVTKIGRRWADMNNTYRFAMDDLHVDGRGYSSPGRIWLSLAEYEEAKAADRAWWKLNEAMRGIWTRPRHLTAPKIEAMLSILNTGDPS